MALVTKTQSIYTATTVTGAQTATHWFEVPRGDAAQMALAISLTAGTATIIIEGRNHPSDAAIQLVSVSASSASLITRLRQIRVHVTAATGATIQVSTDEPVLDIGS